MSERGLFEPDVLLKDQFTARSGATVSREKRLMLAVLENALDSYQKYVFSRDGQGRQLFEEALEWLDSPNNDWLFSFRNICETLDINPDYLRQGLKDWRRRAGLQQEARLLAEASMQGPSPL